MPTVPPIKPQENVVLPHLVLFSQSRAGTKSPAAPGDMSHSEERPGSVGVKGRWGMGTCFRGWFPFDLQLTRPFVTHFAWLGFHPGVELGSWAGAFPRTASRLTCWKHLWHRVMLLLKNLFRSVMWMSLPGVKTDVPPPFLLWGLNLEHVWNTRPAHGRHR